MNLAIDKIQLTEKAGIRFIQFQSDVSNDAISQLLKQLTTFAFFDEDFPELTDPGAYLSYSREAATDSCWSMTLGNHGWSGGIYQIPESTVIIQLSDLIKKKAISEIQIDKVAFFSHYAVQPTEKSTEQNKEILSYHGER